jgi:hypothetical protein
VRRFFASCSIVLVAVVLLGACRGSGPKTPASSDTKAGTSDTDFAKLYADAAKQKFKITFTIGGSEDEKTYAQDGNGNSVYTAGDSQTFTSSAGTVVCTASSGTPTCGKVAEGATATAFLDLYKGGMQYVDALGDRLGDVSSKTIADRDARCVTISAQSIGGAVGDALGAFKGSGTYCIDTETGVLLEVSRTDGEGDESTAFIVTKFEEPSASEFTPPATTQTTTGYTLPGD